MARQETILSVFVASPSDVEEERNRLDEVINEINTTWARKLGIRLELIRWETHAYPSAGNDSQSVINEQISQDYDLFIGLMWYRFGTKTEHAGSGTVEEFQLAKRRYDANPSDLQLMIYFKDASPDIPLSQLDHTQLASVKEFRLSLGDEGILHWSFQTADEFEKIVRLHLYRHVQTWQSQITNSQPSTPPLANAENSSKDSLAEIEEDEPGLLDLVELAEIEFSTLIDVIKRIANATQNIGNKVTTRSTEIAELNANLESNTHKIAKRLFERVATDMDKYVHRIETEIPLFNRYLNSGMNQLTQAVVLLSIDFNANDDNIEEIKSYVKIIGELRETMYTAENETSGLRETVSSLPRVTTVFNRSKRATANVLQQLVDELRSAQMILQEAETSIVSIIDER